MEGRTQPQGMSHEQFAEAQRVFEVNKQAVEDELWRMACLTASKEDAQMFGETEFQLRDIVLRVAAGVLQNAVNQRRKKGGTQGAASPAGNASGTPASSNGGRRRSSACSAR